ncbi:MAG: TraI/MobA(P) family conjugative relaxase [Devosia sp.]
MIAKRITTKAASPRFARLSKYMVAAQGQLDPRSWTRTANYMLDSGISSRGEKVGGIRVTNCNTNDPAAATTLIECCQSMNTTSKIDKTYHMVFSFPPGENPDLKTLHYIEDELCKGIGYEHHQRISAVHIDTDHLHVHVAINKVMKNHRGFYANIEPRYDIYRLMEICERLELELGLTRTNHGLTGERKREQHSEIRLKPEQRLSIHAVKQLRKSHVLALAAGEEKSNNYGMPELPGSDVAHIERGYSELLPGDARNRVFSERTKHADSLRRAGHGASRSGPRVNSKTADAEAHAGIETLIGFIKREAAPSIHAAKSWQELHSALSDHGLTMKQRGAGIVIGNGTLWVRASQCDRSFSFKSLADRLGAFEKASETREFKPYQPAPRHKDSSALFDQYQAQRMKHKKARDYGFELVKYKGKELEANLQRWRVAQRALIKLAAKGPTRRAMLKLLNLQIAATRRHNKASLVPMRQQALIDAAMPTWAQWLAQRAEQGDLESLEVLRSREQKTPTTGDYLTAATRIRQSILSRGKATTSGNIVYNTEDGGYFIDRKTHVQVLKATDKSVMAALKLAQTSYVGQELIIEGSDQFKKAVANMVALQRSEISKNQGKGL